MSYRPKRKHVGSNWILPQEPDGPQFKRMWLLTVVMAMSAVWTFRSAEAMFLQLGGKDLSSKDGEGPADNWKAEICTFLTFVMAFFIWCHVRVYFSRWRQNAESSNGGHFRMRGVDVNRMPSGILRDRSVLPDRATQTQATGPSDKIDDYLRAVLAWCHAGDLVRAEKLLMGSIPTMQVRHMVAKDAHALVCACIEGGGIRRSAIWLQWLGEQGVRISPDTIKHLSMHLSEVGEDKLAQTFMDLLTNEELVEDEANVNGAQQNER